MVVERCLVSYTDENGCTINAHTETDGTLSITDSAGNTICTSKEAKKSPVYLPGQTTQITDKLGGVAAVTFDNNGNLTQTEDVMGNTTAYTYDSLGRVISEENAAKEKTSYDYDRYGRPAKITDAAGNEIEYEYDKAGRITPYL